jgi:hypothetical protein
MVTYHNADDVVVAVLVTVLAMLELAVVVVVVVVVVATIVAVTAAADVALPFAVVESQSVLSVVAAVSAQLLASYSD